VCGYSTLKPKPFMAMKKMAGMLGCSREEMIGSFIWDYADEEDKGVPLQKIQKNM